MLLDDYHKERDVVQRQWYDGLIPISEYLIKVMRISLSYLQSDTMQTEEKNLELENFKKTITEVVK